MLRKCHRLKNLRSSRLQSRAQLVRHASGISADFDLGVFCNDSRLSRPNLPSHFWVSPWSRSPGISSKSYQRSTSDVLYKQDTPSFPSPDTEKPAPWHDKNFMSHASIEEKEEWLGSLLRQPVPIADAKAFLVVLKPLSESAKAGSARRAELWMSRMEAVDLPGKRAQSSDVEAILECYLRTIQAWVTSVGEDIAVRVNRSEKVLEHAKKFSSGFPPSQVQPLLTYCYNAYLDACSKGSNNKKQRATVRSHTRKAESIFQNMLQQFAELGDKSPVIPNTESANYVLRAITRCRNDDDIADRAKIFLKDMENGFEQLHNQKAIVIQPNPKSYNMVLNSIATVAFLKARRSQNRKGKEDNGMKDMQDLQDSIDFMRQLFEKGRLGIIENNIPYNTLLTAWANLSGLQHYRAAPMQAEKVFYDMEDLRDHHDFQEVAPDATSYLQVSVF
jgi:hypothetical protein